MSSKYYTFLKQPWFWALGRLNRFLRRGRKGKRRRRRDFITLTKYSIMRKYFRPNGGRAEQGDFRTHESANRGSRFNNTLFVRCSNSGAPVCCLTGISRKLLFFFPLLPPSSSLPSSSPLFFSLFFSFLSLLAREEEREREFRLLRFEPLEPDRERDFLFWVGDLDRDLPRLLRKRK